MAVGVGVFLAPQAARKTAAINHAVVTNAMIPRLIDLVFHDIMAQS